MPVSFSSLAEAYELVFSIIGGGALLLIGTRMQRLVSAILIANVTFLYAVVDVKGARHRAVVLPLLVIAFVKGLDVAIGHFRGQHQCRAQTQLAAGRQNCRAIH